jgi:hypothetical protein
MATAVIAGLATAGGAVAAAGGWAAFTAASGSLFAAFSIGAGLSLVSQALMPKPSMGAQVSGTTTTVREPASTRKMVYGRARVGGSIVYLDSTGTDNEYMHMVIAVAGHAIDAYEEVWFNDEKIWDGGSFVGSWSTYVDLNFHDGTQTTADANLVSRSTQWTTNHKLLDTAYIYVRLKYDAEQFANGLPNISTVIRGKKVYNPANSTTAWSQNPALIVRDYLLDSKYGLAEDASNINAASVSTAQTLCDQDVSLSAGGTQKRYVCDGVIDTGNSRESNIEALLSAMAGRLIHSGGEYFISGSAYVTPTVTIDESVLAGAISTQTKQSRRSIYNGVKGVFLSEEDNYILADYPAQISSTYSSADGDPIYLDMPLPTTTNNIRAQRLAKLALLQSRQQTQVTLPCNLAALKFKAGDNIMVTNAKIGWSAKVFQVTGYNFALGGDGSIIVNVQAIETASAIYDWASSDEEDYLSGGEVDLYDGRTVAAPTSFAGTASTATNLDGTIAPQIVSTWTASADAFVVKYDYQWSTNNSDWNSFDVEGTQFTISPTIGAATYYTRVRAVNELGVRSAFVTANVTAVGDTTAPAVVSSPSATAGQGSITLAWINPADKDFSNAEIYRSNTTGGTYTAVASVAGGHGLPSSFVNGSLDDSEDYFYKIKSVDYSGNKSTFSAIVSATTDAPASPPRADNGYVYYTQSSANAPSTPSATSYNYDTASFGGLTANWQKNPPTINGADGKFWASSFTITESSFGGSQTITFSAPFASTQFDGLVTFTNLNSELANASSTEITTINGGLIKTGLIDANRVKIDDATIDTDGSGNLIIKAGGVGTTQMGDLQVSTIKIAGNAVNLIRTAVSTSDITLTKNAWTDIATITFTPESVSGSAQPISIKAFSDFEFDILASVNKTAAVTFRYVKNGTNIKEFNEIFFSTYLSGYGIGYYGTASGNITPIFIDTDTTVSSRSYKLQAFYTNTETGKDCTVHAGATLECVEVKR